MPSDSEEYSRIIHDREIRCARMGHLPVYDNYRVTKQSSFDDKVRGRCVNCFRIFYRPLNAREIRRIIEMNGNG